MKLELHLIPFQPLVIYAGIPVTQVAVMIDKRNGKKLTWPVNETKSQGPSGQVK